MKRALKIVAIVIGILIVLVLVLPFVINANTFRPQIEAQLTTALGRKVTVGNLSFSILSGSLGADDIAIADDPAYGSSPFVSAKSFGVGVEVIPLILSKTLHVTDLTLKQPEVMLIRSRSGKWNFSSLGGNQQKPASSSPDQSLQSLSVGRLSIKEGLISITDQSSRAKPRVYKNVDLTVKDFSFTSQFPFTLTADLPGGGTVKLDGNAGPINPNDAASTPLEAKLNVHNLDLAASGFVDPSSGISGVADFDGSVKSDGKQATSGGHATADKLKFSPKGSPGQKPVNLQYATTYDLQKQSGRLTQGDVSVGKAVAKLSGAYDLQGDSASLNMKLNADNMPVDDLQAMLPPLGVTLPSGSSLQGGTLSSDLTIVGPVNKLVITGPVKLADTKLRGFDMGSKLSAISALSGVKTGQDTSIQNFSSDVHVAPSGIQTQNINLVVPALGTLTGSGTINPDNALDYKMTASLNGAAISSLTQLAGVGGKENATIPFFIQGTAQNPRFVPDVKGMLGSQLGGQLGNKLGSQVPGGQNGQNVVNAIGGLFGKKKKQ
jgi:AsmA protein